MLLLVLLACSPKPTPPAEPVDPTPMVHEGTALNPVAVAGVTDPGLRGLLHDHWEDTMQRSPVWATMLGDHRFDDRLGDPSAAGVTEARAARDGFLHRARAMHRGNLTPSDKLTLDLFVHDLEESQSRDICDDHLWRISPRSNALVDLNYVPAVHPRETPADLETLLARLRAMPYAIDEEVGNLRVGLETGRVNNRATLLLVVDQFDRQLATPHDEWPLMVSAESLPEPERDAFDAKVHAVVEGEIAPALSRYRDFVADELLPAAPEAVGLTTLPNGAACYAAQIHAHTTLPVTAEELHQTGLDELARIHDEFRTLGEPLFGTRDLAAIFERLRTDPALYFEDADQVRAKAESSVASAKAAIPEWFGRLPVADVVVTPIPDYEAPFTTIAYYQSPNPDGSKPGEYFLNLYAPETRPRHEAQVLAFHEAIPGHHLQIAIAQELPDLPAFRRHGGFTAFVEGWGLYSERLADEMGLYDGDVDRMGMLSFDAWRAGRLVVDTGIHHLGWSREQAVAFLIENTPQAPNNIENEVDRYINTPGQALAYKTGQLRIRALRAEAEQALGDRFDLPAFHDVVLGAGAVPLPVLEERVRAWIAAQG